MHHLEPMAGAEQRRNACAWLSLRLTFEGQIHDRPQESARILRPSHPADILRRFSPCATIKAPRRSPTATQFGDHTYTALRIIKKSIREKTLMLSSICSAAAPVHWRGQRNHCFVGGRRGARGGRRGARGGGVAHGAAAKLDAAPSVQAKDRRGRLLLSANWEMRVHSVNLGYALMAWADAADRLRTHLRQAARVGASG